MFSVDGMNAMIFITHSVLFGRVVIIGCVIFLIDVIFVDTVDSINPIDFLKSLAVLNFSRFCGLCKPYG